MANHLLPDSQKESIIEGIRNNVRGDGRGCLEYRDMQIETGVIWSCSGSAFVKIGETKLAAGVRTELMRPKPNCPDSGWIEVSMTSTPHDDFGFERSGGYAFLSEIDQILTRTCNNDALLDLKSLCIIPNRLAWALFVDIMILGYDGNLIDAASMVTKAALYDTKIETMAVTYDDGDIEPQFDYSGAPYEVKSLGISNLPLLITFVQIANEFIVDATDEEESCRQCKLVFAISPMETEMHEVDRPRSLPIKSVQAAIEASEEVGVKLQKLLMDKLQNPYMDMLEFEKTAKKSNLCSC